VLLLAVIRALFAVLVALLMALTYISWLVLPTSRHQAFLDVVGQLKEWTLGVMRQLT
jgi:hypothetical protein